MSKPLRKRDLQEWDDAAFVLRADPEREKKPRRVNAITIKLPKRLPAFDAKRAAEAWKRLFNLIVDEAEIAENAAMIARWSQQRPRLKNSKHQQEFRKEKLNLWQSSKVPQSLGPHGQRAGTVA
jgi:hypothetical protein